MKMSQYGRIIIPEFTVLEDLLIRKVTLSMNEQKKYEVIKNLVDHQATANKQRAALKLGCTKRHINRLIKGYKEQGKAFFIHGNKGRKPASTIPKSVRNKIIDLYRNKYFQANFKHFTELLALNENISVSLSSVTNILQSIYILSPKVTKAKRRRLKKELALMQKNSVSKKEHDFATASLVSVENAHSRRPRSAYFGELQQMDATPYAWIDGQIWHLHLAIDDATGRITGAFFDTQETLSAYYRVFQQILVNYGIPFKFLTDRRTVFTYRKLNAPSDDKDSYTQFAYACKQLGVVLESISVPQAKGRVERLNQTLQSRLPVELRLAGITDINSANEFLSSYIKKFNEKFSLPLHSIKSVFDEQPDLKKINLTLAVLTERTIDCGHAVQFQNHFYRLLDHDSNPVHYKKGTSVMVIQALDSSLFACVNDKDIYALEEIPKHEPKSKNFDFDYTPPKPKKRYIPPMSHPWKKLSFERFLRSQAHRSDKDHFPA